MTLIRSELPFVVRHFSASQRAIVQIVAGNLPIQHQIKNVKEGEQTTVVVTLAQYAQRLELVDAVGEAVSFAEQLLPKKQSVFHRLVT